MFHFAPRLFRFHHNTLPILLEFTQHIELPLNVPRFIPCTHASFLLPDFPSNIPTSPHCTPLDPKHSNFTPLWPTLPKMFHQKERGERGQERGKFGGELGISGAKGKK
jgi:hypothetical protein